MQKIVILLGPPGAGKGTQAKRLSAALSLPHVSTGDLFREHKRRGTEFGRRAREFMDSGRLVPDEVVLDMLFERVAEPDCEAGCVLDGFPRTRPQAQALADRLGPDATLWVLNLAVDDDVLVDRLTGRRSCNSCGKVFHTRFSPPRAEGRCDDCGGELVQRADDTPEVVERRLDEYRAKTRPLVEYYRNLRLLTEVDGSAAPDVVFQELMSVVQGEAA